MRNYYLLLLNAGPATSVIPKLSSVVRRTTPGSGPRLGAKASIKDFRSDVMLPSTSVKALYIRLNN
jgi:hypothetical protein